MVFKIVATTDVHGNLFSRSFLDGSPVPYGAARLSTYLQELRSKFPVVYIDNGDTNQGTALLTYFNKHSDRKIMAELWEYLGVDYANIGNHDFNYGGQFLADFTDALHCPMICTNAFFEGRQLGQSQIFEREGKTFALIGAVTDYIEHWETPQNLVGVEVTGVLETVKAEVERLRPQVDYLIVAYHGGLEADPQTGEPTEKQTGENVGYRLCTEIPGIDLLISGHQHRSLITSVNGVPFTQSPDKAAQCVEITVDVNGPQVFDCRLVDLSTYPVDTQLEAHFEADWEETGRWLDTAIGTAEWDDLYITDFVQAQKDKHPFTTFVNHLQQEVGNAELSACCMFEQMPGWGKHLTYRDVFLNYPFPNTLVVKEVTGQIVLDYLNQVAQYWCLRDGQIEINQKFLVPKHELYNYDLVDGVSYTICVGPDKSWVEDVLYRGEPIDPQQVFRLAINNYRASGGGGFQMLVDAPTVFEDTRDMSEILIEYITGKVAAGEPLTVSMESNIRLRPCP